MIGNYFFTSVNEFDESIRKQAFYLLVKRGITRIGRDLCRKLYRDTGHTKAEIWGIQHFLNESRLSRYRNDYGIIYRK